MTITEDMHQAIPNIPDRIWEPASDADGQARPGAWVAELTGLLDLAGWPAGMRVIARKDRPHPGAQLRFTDLDGHRFTCFATDAQAGQLADLELRHRRRARCEDRILLPGSSGCRATWHWSVLRRAFATHLAGAALVIAADQKPDPREPATCATPRVAAE